MKNTVTREDIDRFIRNACVDSESVIEINGHTVTVIVREIWNDEGDIEDYKYTFTIDNEEADECDVYRLIEES